MILFDLISILLSPFQDDCRWSSSRSRSSQSQFHFFSSLARVIQLCFFSPQLPTLFPFDVDHFKVSTASFALANNTSLWDSGLCGGFVPLLFVAHNFSSSFALRRLRFSPYWLLFFLSLCLLKPSYLNYHTISKSLPFQRHDGDFFLRQWSSDSLYSFNRKILTSSNKSTPMASIHAGSYQWSFLAYRFVAVEGDF